MVCALYGRAKRKLPPANPGNLQRQASLTGTAALNVAIAAILEGTPPEESLCAQAGSDKARKAGVEGLFLRKQAGEVWWKMRDPEGLAAFFGRLNLRRERLDLIPDVHLDKQGLLSGVGQSPDFRGLCGTIELVERFRNRVGELETMGGPQQPGDKAIWRHRGDLTGCRYLEEVAVPQSRQDYLRALASGPLDDPGIASETARWRHQQALGYPAMALGTELYKRVVDQCLSPDFEKQYGG